MAKAWLCKSLIPGSNPGDACPQPSARMVELVDTQDLKSCVRKDVRVRPPLRVILSTRKLPMIKYSILLVLQIYFINCSSTIFLRKSDYDSTRGNLLGGNLQAALQSFPNRERGTFIPIMEKTYINLLNGNPDIVELTKISKKLEKRIRYGLQREISNFFYMETPEGYYASEHEIIWMHFLLSWGYSLKGEYDKALIELRKSNNYLSGEISEEGRFDDPLMRIFQGFLFVLAGNWEDARVDFKRAYTLDPSQKNLLELFNLESPPDTLILVINGGGLEPYWDPQMEFNPVRGFRTLNFSSNAKYSKLKLTDLNGKDFEMVLSPKSNYWYKRHFKRDTEMHDVIKDSKYSQQIVGSLVKGTIVSMGGLILGTTIAVCSIGIGGGVIYLGLKSGNGDIASYGLLLGVGIIYKGFEFGYEIAENSLDFSKKDLDETLDTSETYRFVRFLPEYLNYQKLNSPNGVYYIKNSKEKINTNSEKIGKEKNLIIKYYPDN